MITRDTLRLNGYSATADGLLDCHGAGAINPYHQSQDHRRLRFVQEHCAVIRIGLEDGSKVTREIIEQLISAADSPRALVGRKRDGAVLLFRHEEGTEILPSIPGDISGGAYKLDMGGERFTLTIKSENQTVDVSAYNWGKRSPLDVERDRLPVLTSDLTKLVLDAAYKVARTAPTEAELDSGRAFEARVAKYREDIAAGRIKDPTPAELAEAADEALDRAHPKDISWQDGILQGLVQQARARIAARRRKAEASA